MGIFSDFANSAAGDLTIGAFEGLNQAAQKDVVVNATASNDALRKENDAFLITETAFKNRKEDCKYSFCSKSRCIWFKYTRRFRYRSSSR